VNYLLDTHVWLWILAEPQRLGPGAIAIVENTENRLVLSAASSWEIAIKFALGRLPMPEAPDKHLLDWMRRTGVDGLAVEHHHALAVATLPMHHRDPFDRLLVAQAQIEHLPILTADPLFDRYDIEVVTAA